MKDHFELVYLADRDYIAARLLNFCGSALYPQAAYHSQQCIEKYLKALLAQKNKIFPQKHKLNELRSLCEKHYKNLSDKKVIDSINEFDILEQVSRYGPFANFDPMSKKVKGQFETRGVFVWQDTNVKDLDYLVFELRGNIDFDNNSNANDLQSVLSENVRNILVNGWKLKYFTIKDVLTSHNDYFRKIDS